MDAALLEEVPCNLCGARRDRELYYRPYRLKASAECGSFAATTDEFSEYGRIVRCDGCGLVYTNPRPKASALHEGYAGCVDEAYLAESSSRSINAYLSLNTLKRHVSSGRLLEVGASTGYFLNAARANFEVVGLEPSEWACRIARERFKLEVYPETLESCERFAPGSFDAVAMVDVIEHVSDPQGALKKAAELLKPGGVLYLLTPNIDSLSARLLGSYWWGLRPAHIYYFSPRTIERLLANAGLEVLINKSYGRIFSYGYWHSRLRHYPAPIYSAVGSFIRLLGIEDKLVYWDTRDSMELCARKRC